MSSTHATQMLLEMLLLDELEEAVCHCFCCVLAQSHLGGICLVAIIVCLQLLLRFHGVLRSSTCGSGRVVWPCGLVDNAYGVLCRGCTYHTVEKDKRLFTAWMSQNCNVFTSDTCAWTMSYYACMSWYADYIHTRTQLSTGASRKAPVDNACLYVCMHVCMYGWMDRWIYGCMAMSPLVNRCLARGTCGQCVFVCMYARMEGGLAGWAGLRGGIRHPGDGLRHPGDGLTTGNPELQT